MTTTPHTVLPAAQPFELALSLRAMAGFAPCAGEQLIAGRTVRKAFALDGGPAEVAEVAVLVEVAQAEGGVALALHSARELSDEQRRAARRAVCDWLSLADDPTRFLAVARADPAMRPVLAETEGLHQVRFASLAEGAAYFVLTQRTSARVAGARKRRLAAAYGPAVEHEGQAYRAFPTLDRLAGLTEGELAGFAANHRQAEYLAATFERLAGWPPGWGHTADHRELVAELRGIRGVGEFTASGIALRVLGRLETTPAPLPAFTDAIATLYGPGVAMADVERRYGDQVGLWGYHVRTGLGWLGAGAPGAVSPARAGSSARTPPRPRRRAG